MIHGRKFRCSWCPHKSSRKDNMKVHLKRWHGGNGEPINIGGQTETLLKGHQKPSSPANSTGSSKSLHSPTAKPSNRPESIFNCINKFHSQFVEAFELRRKLEEMAIFFGGNVSRFPQLILTKA